MAARGAFSVKAPGDLPGYSQPLSSKFVDMSKSPEAGAPPSIPWAYAVAQEQKPFNAHILLRGEPEKPGEEVPRRWSGVLGGQPLATPAESGRRELGQWISSHPASARVMANRVWQWHFGNGIVRSSSDFVHEAEARIQNCLISSPPNSLHTATASRRCTESSWEAQPTSAVAIRRCNLHQKDPKTVFSDVSHVAGSM